MATRPKSVLTRRACSKAGRLSTARPARRKSAPSSAPARRYRKRMRRRAMRRQRRGGRSDRNDRPIFEADGRRGSPRRESPQSEFFGLPDVVDLVGMRRPHLLILLIFVEFGYAYRVDAVVQLSAQFDDFLHPPLLGNGNVEFGVFIVELEIAHRVEPGTFLAAVVMPFSNPPRRPIVIARVLNEAIPDILAKRGFPDVEAIFGLAEISVVRPNSVDLTFLISLFARKSRRDFHRLDSGGAANRVEAASDGTLRRRKKSKFRLRG